MRRPSSKTEGGDSHSRSSLWRRIERLELLLAASVDNTFPTVRDVWLAMLRDDKLVELALDVALLEDNSGQPVADARRKRDEQIRLCLEGAFGFDNT